MHWAYEVGMPDRVDVFVIGSFIVAASTLVARLPAPGESLAADNLILEPGGKGFNLALGLHRLGVSVHGIMAVGDDIFAAFAVDALERAGLPSSMLRHLAGQTGAGIGFSSEDGGNCLAIFAGANARLSAEDVVAHEALAKARFVLAQFETGDAAILAGFRVGRSRGAQTLLNPSPYRTIDPDILRNTSILIVNETEAEHCARDLGAEIGDHDALARELHARGVTAHRKDRMTIHRAGLPVAVVDPLGAGDAFTCGLVAGLAESNSPSVETHNLEASLSFGNACGAFCVGRLGVYDALPYAKDISRY
jgi:ribokinase